MAEQLLNEEQENQGQEQVTEMPVEAPESVPETTSPESNANVAPQQDNVSEDVTETPTPRTLDSVLRETVPSVISDGPRVRVSPKVAEDMAETTKLALENVSGDEVNVEDVKRRIRSAGIQGIREHVSQAEYNVRAGGLQRALQESIAATDMEAKEIAESLKFIAEQKPLRTALEQEAVTSAMTKAAAEDPEWLAIYEGDIDVTSKVQDELESQLLLYNYIQEKAVAAEEDFDFGIDFVRGLTSVDLLGKVMEFGPNFADGLKEFGRRYNQASTTEERLSILEEFDEVIDQAFVGGSIMDTNPDFALDLVNLAFNATPEERKQALVLGGFEGILSLVGLGATAKGLKGVRRVGSSSVKEKAGKVDGEEVLNKAKESVEGQEEIVTLKEPESPVPSNYTAVQRELARQQSVIDDTVENLTSPVKRTEYEELPVFDGAVVIRQETDATGGLISDLGTKKGNPFSRRGDAQRRANALGLADNEYEIIEDTAGYVIRYKTDRDAWNAPATETRRAGYFRRRFDNVDNWVDGVIHSKARLAEGAYGQVEAAFRKVWNNGIRPLNAKQSRDVVRSLEVLRKKNTTGEMNRWWTEGEFVEEYKNLTGQVPTEKEVVAYRTYQQLNDFAWRLDNRVMYESAQQEGYKTISIKGIGVPFTGKQVDNLSDDITVFDLERGAEVNAGDLLGRKTEYDIVLMRNSDKYDMIDANILPVTRAKYVAVPKNKVKVDDLDPVQLPYKAGGRVNYDRNTVFLKQLNVREVEGQKLRFRDKTMYRADSPQEAAEYASRWNKAREIAYKVQRGQLDSASVRQAFREYDVGELDDFLKNAEAYGWDLTEPMQVVRNRETISVSNVGSDFIDETDDLEYIMEGVGNRFSRRGQGVPHILGEAGNGPLDPIASLSESIDLTARNAAFSQFREAALERFKSKFGSYVDVPTGSPLTAYLRAPVNKRAADANLVETIEGTQKYLQEVMSIKYADERMWDRLVGKIADWSFKGLGKDLGSTVARSMNAARGFSPTAQARNLIFNAKLGMFNPASFIMQIAQAPIVAITAPKYGLRSLTTYPLFRMALYGTDDINSGLMKEMAQKWKSLPETEFAGDLEEAVREFRRMGMDNFGGNMAYIDANTGSNVLGLAKTGAGRAASSVADKGRFFFNEGELMPRAVSYLSARARWLNDKTVNPKGLPPTSNAGRQWIHDTANKYVLGMSRADIQQGLRGGLSGVAFQFYSFVFRATAAFTGRQFTSGEKLRMALGYVALYGGAGVPVLGWALQELGEKYNSTAMQQFAERGFVDGVLSSALGYEADFSTRAGIGQAWDDIWNAVLGEKSVLEVAGGAAGNTGSRAFDSITDMLRTFSLVSNPDPEIITRETVLGLAKQVSSFNNVYKAMHAWETGKLVSSRGTSYLPVTRAELLGQIAGVPTFKYSELDAIFAGRKEREDAIKDGTQDVLLMMEEIAKERDPERKQRLQSMLSLKTSNMLSAGIWEDVSFRVFSEMEGSTLYKDMFLDSVLYQMEFPEQQFYNKGVVTPERLQQITEEQENR